MRVVGQKSEPLALHVPATSTIHTPHLEFEVDARVPVGQIARPANRTVVPTPMQRPTRAAQRFFERRTSDMTRALRSPNTPRTVGSGRKAGNLYASERRFGFDEVGIGKSRQICAHRESPGTLYPGPFQIARTLNLYPNKYPKRQFTLSSVTGRVGSADRNRHRQPRMRATRAARRT